MHQSGLSGKLLEETKILDTLIPFGKQWPYVIVRDEKMAYHLLKGGAFTHTWTAANEQRVIDTELPVLYTDFVRRATEYRAANKQKSQ